MEETRAELCQLLESFCCAIERASFCACRVVVESTCTSACTKKLLPQEIYLIDGLFHMHLLGKLRFTVAASSRNVAAWNL